MNLYTLKNQLIMCLSPISISRTYLGRKVVQWCPCGKCEECIKDKQNEYIIRTIEEAMKIKGDVYFLTLTYNEDNVPTVVDEEGELDEETGELCSIGQSIKSLNNKDITLWKKRCKRYIEYHYKTKCDFSYLICGEYGPQTHRPHYHGLFLGISPRDMEIFKRDWETNYGYTCIKEVSKFDVERTARYVAKYITKMRDLEDKNVMNGKVEKPRKITSKGYGMPSKERWKRMKIDVMGEDYSVEDLQKMVKPGQSTKKVSKIIEKVTRSLKYKNNGKEYKLPAYYRKKMFYYKDDFGKVHGTTVSNMVAQAMVNQVQSDYSRKLVEMANNLQVGETFEDMRAVACRVQAIEEDTRQTRKKMYIQTNIAALRKSIF